MSEDGGTLEWGASDISSDDDSIDLSGFDVGSEDFLSQLMSQLEAPENEGILDMIDNQLEPEEQGFNLSEQDVLDVLGEGLAKADQTKKPIIFRQHPEVNIYPRPSRTSTIDTSNIPSDVDLLTGEKYLLSREGRVYVVAGDLRNLVGYSQSTKRFRVKLNLDQIKRSLNVLYEDCNAKGTGLGFSSYIHSYAMLIICHTDAEPIYEPQESFDVRTSYSTFEVTGKNAHRRRTDAECCINKYALLASCIEPDEDLVDQIRLAKLEDDRRPDGFWGTSLDQDASPYTKLARELATATRSLTARERDGLVGQFRCWLSRQEPIVNNKERSHDAPAAIREALERGSKNGKLPCPLKVMFPTQADVPADFANQHVQPHILNASVGSTYHTIDIDDLNLDACSTFGPKISTATIYSEGSHLDILYNVLLRYPCFQAAHIMAELYGKIIGREGFFYSKYSEIGIAWKRVRSNSLSFFVAFYSYSIPGPEELVGKWARVEAGPLSKFGYYLGPTHKISIRDIQFAQVVSVRMFTLITSMLAYSDQKHLSEYLTPVLSLLPMVMSSSWQTSALAGDMRFYTLCKISDSGDVDALAVKAAESVQNKPLSSADTYFLYLLGHSCENDEHGLLSRTPLLGLPMRFLCIEKDLPHMMMWHIRGDAHATECMRKMLKSKVDEKDEREGLVKHLEKQLAYLHQIKSTGVTQQDFDQLMNHAPKTVYYNHVMNIALQRRSVSRIADTLGPRQMSSGFSLTTMLTDHHAVTVNDPSKIGVNTFMKNVRVMDANVELLAKYGNPQNAYDLLVRMARGSKILNIYGMHEKDSKSGNREISQMIHDCRPLQAFSEFMCRAFCNTDDADMMLDPEKFSKVIMTMVQQLRKRATARSEDKSFFCGRLFPELLGLSVYNIGLESGSTSLVGAGGAIMTDTCRYVVMPAKLKTDSFSKECFDGSCVRIVQKKNVDVMYSKLYRHMQQGIRAVAAAAHSTCFSVGIAMFQEDLLPSIDSSALFTTSDDAVRSYVPSEQTTRFFCRKSLNDEYFGRHVKMMEHQMMMDNVKKPIESQALAEFNNFVVNRNGMMPQQFIHTSLIIQPLKGQSLISDIIDAVSSARQSIFWGDSLDVATATYESYLLLLRQKWLLSTEDLDVMHSAGLLPDSDEQLLEGFAIRNNRTLWNLWDIVDDETKDRIRRGEVKLEKALSRFSLAKPKKPVKKRERRYTKQTLLYNRTVETILSSRDYTQRLAGSYIRPAHIDDRARARNQLMNVLRSKAPEPSHEDQQIMMRLTSRTRITICPIPIRPGHTLPRKQGTSQNARPGPNRNVIIAYRAAAICLGRKLEAEEEEISQLPDDEFNEWLTNSERRTDYEGFAFTSPTGFPRMRFLNGEMYTRPMSFTFFSDIEEQGRNIREFTFKGDSYDNFELISWGGKTLDSCRARGAVPCFGRSAGFNRDLFFYYDHAGKMAMYAAPNSSVPFQIVTLSNVRIGVLRQVDMTPIIPEKYLLSDYTINNVVPGMTGDNVAIANYGDYLNTNSKNAFNAMTKIFEKLGSRRPGYLRRYAKSYPSFSSSAVEIPLCRTTLFVGSASSKRVKLVRGDEMRDMVKVDCTGRLPTHSFELDSHYDDDFDFE